MDTSEIEKELRAIKELLIQSLNLAPVITTNPSVDFMDVQACSNFLKISKATVYAKTSKGELPYLKRFGRNYYVKQAMIEFLKSGAVRSNSEIEAEAENSFIRANQNRTL